MVCNSVHHDDIHYCCAHCSNISYCNNQLQFASCLTKEISSALRIGAHYFMKHLLLKWLRACPGSSKIISGMIVLCANDLPLV